jgi:hypothetical protein
MTDKPSPRQTQAEADYADSPVPGEPPKRWALLLAWTWPVAIQFLVWFVLFRPADPQITLWIRCRNFVRGIVGVPAHVSFALGLTDPNGLGPHALMAAIVWPVLLSAVTLTPIRRLPLAAHVALSTVWTFGGCCLVLGI